MHKLIEVTREYIGDELTEFIGTVIDYVPYLGNINKSIKMNRATRRIKEHAESLKRIDQLFKESTLPLDYIQEKIGPIILSDLIEEHEDAKITYILHGFENIFINERKNESIIINYYDTLRSLRYEDIRKLYFYAGITNDNFEGVLEGSEEEAFSQHLYSKLERYHLVANIATIKSMQLGASALKEEERNVVLTNYGLNLIKFITLDFDEKKYFDKINNYKIEDRFDGKAKFGWYIFMNTEILVGDSVRKGETKWRVFSIFC